MIQTSSAQSLVEPDQLCSLLGEDEVVIDPVDTVGFSGSRLYKVRTNSDARFVIKLTELADDWFSRRTNDRVGREAAVLIAPELKEIHELFRLPYRIVAVEDDRFGLVMDDLSEWLLPDERKPVERDVENLIVDRLARLHARFWESSAPAALDWLLQPEQFMYIMGPRDHPAESPPDETKIQELVRTRWPHALNLLSERARKALKRPPEQIASEFSDLPRTLVHGDTKIANFAVDAGGSLCVFDWAFAGHAPCTFDLGWYLAVNASRLTRSKNELIGLYRDRLEHHLERTIDDALWDELETAGVVCGAMMLLWAKGYPVAEGRPGAEMEWSWWADRLESWAARSE